jgi:hypothetical protein
MRLDRDQLAALVHELREVADGIETVLDAMPEDGPITLGYPEASLTARLAVLLDLAR